VQVIMVSAKRNVIANYVGAGVTALMAVAFVPVYVRYLGIASYGLIGIYSILQVWLSLLDMGMTPALSREMARFVAGSEETQALHNLLRSVEVIVSLVGLAIALVVTLASGWLATRWAPTGNLPASTIAGAFSVMGVLVAVRFVEGVYRSSVVGLQRQVFLNVVTSSMATLRAVGAIGVLIFISPTTKAFFLWQGAVSLMTVAILRHYVHRVLPVPPNRPRFSWQALKRIWAFAAGTLVITIQSLLLTQVDKIVLARMLTLEAFGYYTFAVTVSQLPGMATGPVASAFYPRLALLHRQGDEVALGANYHLAAQLMTVLLGSATLMLWLFGNQILEVWTKDRSLTGHTYTLAAVLCLGSFLNGLLVMPGQLQLAAGWTKLIIRINLLNIVVIVPALIFVARAYGAIGAAWMWVFLNASYGSMLIHFMHRQLLPKDKWKWCLGDVLAPFTAAAATAILLRMLVSGGGGRFFTIAKLLAVAPVIALAGTLAAPIVRKHMISLVPATIKRRWDRHFRSASRNPPPR
jgi:O-antigen/teichoic acid export membrane protein